MWKKSFTSRFTSNDFICRQFFDGVGGCCFLRCSLVYFSRPLISMLAHARFTQSPATHNKLNYVGYDSWSGFGNSKREEIVWLAKTHTHTHTALFGLRWSFLYSFGAFDSILKPLDNVRRINFVRFFRYAVVFSFLFCSIQFCFRRIDFSKWNLIR